MNPVCCECCREMQCAKNGSVLKVNDNHYYSGDRYHCKHCNKSVIIGFGVAYTRAMLLTDPRLEITTLIQ